MIKRSASASVGHLLYGDQSYATIFNLKEPEDQNAIIGGMFDTQAKPMRDVKHAALFVIAADGTVVLPDKRVLTTAVDNDPWGMMFETLEQKGRYKDALVRCTIGQAAKGAKFASVTCATDDDRVKPVRNVMYKCTGEDANGILLGSANAKPPKDLGTCTKLQLFFQSRA